MIMLEVMKLSTTDLTGKNISSAVLRWNVKMAKTLKVTYSLNIKSGTAALYWLGSTDEHIILGDKEEHMIAEVTAEDVYEFTF